MSVSSLLWVTMGCQQRADQTFFVVPDDGITGPFPVAIDGDQGMANDMVLIKMNDGKSVEIPFQTDTVHHKIWFMADGNDTLSYVLRKEKNGKGNPLLTTDRNDGNLRLKLGGKSLVSYRYEMAYPPKGVDSIFGKSGFIHPLLAPHGDTLTRIQPPDHYHHYGIWGPWTHTQIKGQQVDFWNLGDRKGTVLFKDFTTISFGDVYATFTASQEHLDFITEVAPQVALNENLKVTLWNLDRPDRYMLDYTSSFETPLEQGILFEAYRYGGGLGMRFTERWHKDNSSVLTSEGEDRSGADGTNARWCIGTGESTDGQGTNGIRFMRHPSNRAHPETMRVWALD